MQVKPSSAGIEAVAEHQFVCWDSGEEHKEAKKEVRPRSGVQRNALWLLVWVKG